MSIETLVIDETEQVVAAESPDTIEAVKGFIEHFQIDDRVIDELTVKQVDAVCSDVYLWREYWDQLPRSVCRATLSQVESGVSRLKRFGILREDQDLNIRVKNMYMVLRTMTEPEEVEDNEQVQRVGRMGDNTLLFKTMLVARVA